jgi:hypothetical protein
MRVPNSKRFICESPNGATKLSTGDGRRFALILTRNNVEGDTNADTQPLAGRTSWEMLPRRARKR